MSTTKNRFIGAGMVFPIEINQEGRPDIKSDMELIRSSIKMILNWRTRTRYFNELFGSRIEDILEEPDDSISKSLLRFFISESLIRWEKRVDVTNIQIMSNGDTSLDARLFYTIRNTKIEDVMIFPFYKNIKY